MEPIGARDFFCFSCAPKVPCFNECCRDLNQILMPYDILRLKNRLGMSSGAFLDRYVSLATGPATGLPVAKLKPVDNVALACPFVTPEGCAVYEDRPSSCRLYPLARALSRSRETGKMTERFALIKESHCLGFENRKQRRPDEWIKSQGLLEYNTINDLLLEIISLKNMRRPGPLEIVPQKMFYMACYDIDSFRLFLFDKGEADRIKAPPELIEASKKDDAKLLQTGLLWLKDSLFNAM